MEEPLWTVGEMRTVRLVNKKEAIKMGMDPGTGYSTWYQHRTHPDGTREEKVFLAGGAKMWTYDQRDSVPETRQVEG